MTYENVISVIGVLGIGGVLGNYFQILWQRHNTILLQKQEFKETRYKCIILLMYGVLDFEKQNPMMKQHGRNFNSVNDLIEELKTEWQNMFLFASDDVLIGTHAFIANPSQETFRKSVLAMRKDLWGGKLSKDIEKLAFNHKNPNQAGKK